MKKNIRVLFEVDKESSINPLFAASYFITLIEEVSNKYDDTNIVAANANVIEASSLIKYEVLVAIIHNGSSELAENKIKDIILNVKNKYKDVNIYVSDEPEISIVKAKMDELNTLKVMALNIVKNMNKNGLYLWNDYYPAEEFEGLIKKEKLYVGKIDNNIVGFFALFDKDDASIHYEWKYNNSKFLEMFSVNVDYLHKGYAQKILANIIEQLQEEGYDSLKLIVYDKNIPAISLYKKIGFNTVEGSYIFINEFRKNEPPRNMIGMEYYINKNE